MAKLGASLSGKSLGIVLLLLFLTGACSRGDAPPGAAGGAPPGVPVKLQEVETGTIEESTEIVGSLEADRSVILRPVIEGRVTQIFVSEGSRVAAGAPVVQLKPDKGQAEVTGAIANVNAQRAALNNAQAQISAAEAERVSAEADLQLQNEQFERISTLVAQGAFARQQLDQVRRDRDAARADLNAAEERVRAARATLDQANSAIQQAQAQANLAGEELQDTRVAAPIAGVVGNIPVKLGDFVNTSSTLTTIIQNQSLNLNITIPVERASQLRVGLPVQLTGPKDGTPIGTGRISFVSPQVNSQSQAILAKATFPNPEGSLRDGQLVRSRVIWNRSPGVSIPTTAISRVAGQTFVFVAQQPQGESKLIARQKPVKLGEIKGNNYQVIEGLQAGEKIIVSGILNLSDGAPIIPQS
ncbi:efflux RND transporter periplasmic adaptor subunit [Microcoleus sp. FACHB-SPT15]|uniref:efflux RND transporter periplasmic adaptor subunit n=1 Tax=Microcoleus sp. FACHB-SPT15 TaxID=2692830 RepID=UPI00177CA5C0|nr:efflux RND transporter periplasmic adaptor subunit [Microcoleus sp. FACHB-SPT15]MBD1805754.1 efflux RND transporter periplasmic adaptor subunit [Microcoleus sp. FACHB-SPT15]